MGLIEKLAAPNPYATQFSVARDLADLILSHAPPATVQIITTETSYFVDHGQGHVNRIIGKLNLIDALLINRLNDAEVFVLTVATYYHDISMFIGRQGNEDPEQVRADHNNRSAEIIQMLCDQHLLNIPNHELGIIKNIIRAHRQIVISTLPKTQRIVGSEIRTQLLGAILRIADSCDCDRSRAPKAIFDLYYDQIPTNSREFWRLHFPVTDVTFENRLSGIVLSVDFSGNIQERVEKFRISNLLRKKLLSELASVEEVFQDYNVPVSHVVIRDFNNNTQVDLLSPPIYENAAIVVLCSKSTKIADLAAIVQPLASTLENAAPLVIEFRPNEGPLFVDAGIRIAIDQLDGMQTQIKDRLGADFRSFETQAFEKTTIRRGVVE